MNHSPRIRGRFLLYGTGALLGASALFAFALAAQGNTPASLFISPSSGTLTVGGTFTVSIFVNTGGQSVNAVQADLKFPPDKLQVVSPSAGKSAVGIWVVQPTYDNRTGAIKFQGAIPNPGINTSNGLISEITFRVVSVGTALIRFEDTSRVLLNDGRGTDVLGNTTGGVYNLALPPPGGPSVSSPTHQDQERWYQARDVRLEWGSEEKIEGYSYVLSNQPVEIPNDISEGRNTTQSYKNLEDGIHYFHIKALRNSNWGGVTHYSIKIDGTPPAHFKVDVVPGPRTVVRRPVVSFSTTDALSGIDHYELKVVPLTLQEGVPPEKNQSSAQGFFIEASSPYIPELQFGDYDVIIRAYDRAGNFVQEVERLTITTVVLSTVTAEGLRIRSNLIVPWPVVWGIGIALVFAMGYFAWHHARWHRRVDARGAAGDLPEELARKLEELKALREKYKGMLLFMVFVAGTLVLWDGAAERVFAEEGRIEIAPPVVTEVSRNITNQEIFYIGGKVVVPESAVTIYLQGLDSGETKSYSVLSDEKGDWFYTHSQFLSSGEYLLWTQARLGGEASPPSSQIPLRVAARALQLGASRISFEMLYASVALGLFILACVLISIGFYHRHHAKRKHARLLEEIRKAEAYIHRGFAVLRKDIEAELALLGRLKETGRFSEREKEQEEKILRDLEKIHLYIGHEIWEIERET